jgi:hypothetical protein
MIRSDGRRSCQLLPLADIKDEAPNASEWKIADIEPLAVC